MAPNKMRITLQGQTRNGARFDFLSVFDGAIGWESNPTNNGHCELGGPSWQR